MADLVQLGIVYPDGTTVWGEPHGEPFEGYSDPRVEGWMTLYPDEREKALEHFERRVRELHAAQLPLPTLRFVKRTVHLEYGDVEVVDE